MDKKAFAAGFVKGLGAHAVRRRHQTMEFKPLPEHRRGDLGSDWKRVGNDIREAMDRKLAEHA